jgi:hypothetical protein
LKPNFAINKTGGSFILKILGYLELSGIQKLNTRPHTGMKYEQLPPLTILKEEASESRTNQVS